MTFGERLRELRKKSGLTIPQLADKLFVSKSYIDQLESSEKPLPTVSRLIQLADIFNCSVDYLLGRAG